MSFRYDFQNTSCKNHSFKNVNSFRYKRVLTGRKKSSCIYWMMWMTWKKYWLTHIRRLRAIFKCRSTQHIIIVVCVFWTSRDSGENKKTKRAIANIILHHFEHLSVNINNIMIRRHRCSIEYAGQEVIMRIF